MPELNPEPTPARMHTFASSPAARWRERLARAGLHRGHAMLAGAAVVVAVWAYLVTHPLGGNAPTGQGTVRVWDVPAATATALEYEAPDTGLRIEAAWDGPDAPYLWVVATSRPKPPPPAAGQPPVPAAAPQVTAFKGNATARRLFEQMAAPPALRDLGRLDALVPKDFGLDAPDTTLVLRRGEGAPLKLELGRMTFGQAARYGHFDGDGHVYLFRTADLRAYATAAAGLMDRDLLGFQAKDAARIVLVMGGFERAFVPLAEPGQWGAAPGAAGADSEAPVEDMSVLVAALGQLAVTRYAPEAEADPALARPALELRLHRAGQSAPVRLELFEPQERTTLARSTHTRRPVEVPAPGVRQVLEKARLLLRRT